MRTKSAVPILVVAALVATLLGASERGSALAVCADVAGTPPPLQLTGWQYQALPERCPIQAPPIVTATELGCFVSAMSLSTALVYARLEIRTMTGSLVLECSARKQQGFSVGFNRTAVSFPPNTRLLCTVVKVPNVSGYEFGGFGCGFGLFTP